MPDDHEIDEHGFAPTRIVRARWSRRHGALHFFRVWMKPGDLAFPEQERRLLGAEHVDALVRFMQHKQRGERDDEIRLDATPMPGGVCPQNNSAEQGEVGDSGEQAVPPTDSLPDIEWESHAITPWTDAGHDWPLDVTDNTEVCETCHTLFRGHKQRVLCKLCFEAAMRTPYYPEGVSPNSSPAAPGEVEPSEEDSTTEGTVAAVDKLLTAYKTL